MTDMTHGDDFGGFSTLVPSRLLQRHKKMQERSQRAEQELSQLLYGMERGQQSVKRVEETAGQNSLWGRIRAFLTGTEDVSLDLYYDNKSQSRTKALWMATGGTGLLGLFTSLDALLRIGGIVLALGCGSLPIVVYALQINMLHSANNNWSSMSSSLSRQPNAQSRFQEGPYEPVDTVDPYAAAELDEAKAIMSNGAGLPVGDVPAPIDTGLKPTAPAAKPYVLKDVVDGMALIEYDQNYWFAAPGGVLPDGSRYIRVVKDKQTGGWKMRTSKGVIVSQKQVGKTEG